MTAEWITALWRRVRALLKRRQLDRDLCEELRFHLAMRQEKYEAGGMTQEEADAAARRRFGNSTGFKETCREMWTFVWLETLAQDLRYGLRQFRRNPGFTAVAVITLALGIGANTAMFSVANAVLLQALPFEKPSQIMDIWSRCAFLDFPQLGLSLPDISDIRSHSTALRNIAVYRYSTADLTGQGAPRHLESVEISQHLFSLLGVRPRLGRLFRHSEMQPGADREVLLSYRLWRAAFGGDPRAVGKSIELSGQPYVIVGIMPPLPKMRFLTDAAIWAPFVPATSQLAGRQFHFFHAVARLKPGHTATEAQAELNTIAERLAKAYPSTNRGWSFRTLPLASDLFGESRTSLLALLGAVGFVLLIACANVANLALARGLSRGREIAVRTALGATRGRLVRQLLMESLLFGLIGGACGLLLAVGGIYGLRGLIPENVPRIQDLTIDWNVMWFAFGVSVIAGLLAGLAPALMISRQDLGMAVKEGGSAAQPGAYHGRQSLREMFVVAELALAMILVVGTGLALRSFTRLRETNLGFEPQQLLTMQLDFPAYRFKTPQASVQFVRQIIALLKAIPGVTGVSAANYALLTGSKAEGTIQIEGAPPPPVRYGPSVGKNSVTPGYFQTLAIPLLAGRDFTEEDRENSAGAVIVNEALARKFFGTVSPIGKRVLDGTDAKGKKEWDTIVGVAGNVRDWNPRLAPKPALYSDIYQSEGSSGVSLIVRTRGNPAAFALAIRDRIRSLDKEQVISEISPVERLVALANSGSTFQTLLLGIFGGLGLMLALVGIYGVISYSVAQRTHEIGIRMALGAQKSDVLGLVVASGMGFAFVGVAIGLMGALALTRFLSSLLYAVKPTDPLTFVAVTLILIGVALLACYVPARRATRVDPMVALRYE